MLEVGCWMLSINGPRLRHPHFLRISVFGLRISRYGVVRFMDNEHKSPDDRNKMTELERIRHSCAHVLATAILRIWPEAQFAGGPPVENGFYYDVDLPHRISPEDFEKIEAEMKKEIKANHPFERVELSRADALAMAERGELGALGPRKEPSKFKLDIIRGI